MASFISNSKMIFWKVSVAGVDWTKMMQESIASITVIYELNKPSRAEIEIISVSFFEDLLTLHQKVDIEMGFSPFNLVKMISGIIMKQPSGNATDKLAYKVEVTGTESLGGEVSRNVIFQIPLKATIVAQVIATAGWVASIGIYDTEHIKKKYMPMQNNQTDLQFLMECAERWKCSMWFEYLPNGQIKCNFYDRDWAYHYGDIIKNKSPLDVVPGMPYILGYRTNAALNNVARVDWEFENTPGGGAKNKNRNKAGVQITDEWGMTELQRAWTITYGGDRWQLKPHLLKKAQANPKLWGEYAAVAAQAGISGIDTTVRTYYEPVTGGSSTHQDFYKEGPLKMSVELNVGDPYVRPPRSALLFHGSPDPRAVSAHLPNFLYEGGEPFITNFKMKKVVTSLNAGKLTTVIDLGRTPGGTI